MGLSRVAIVRLGLAIGCGVFATSILASCSPRPSTASSTLHKAGVVVVHADGSVRQACVRFPEAQINGETLLERAGLNPSVDATNPMGALVCSIEGQGCKFPSEPCFCSCAKLGTCSYWGYFTQDQSGTWTYAPQGASARVVHDGDLDGWIWLQTSSAAAPTQPGLPSVHLADVCPGS